eukprot:4733313-Amphidinium_carterae.1
MSAAKKLRSITEENLKKIEERIRGSVERQLLLIDYLDELDETHPTRPRKRTLEDTAPATLEILPSEEI